MTNNDILIRAYRPADKPAVLSLWQTVFQPTAAHNQPAVMLADKLAHDDGLLFVAVVSGRVVGTTMAGYDGHRGWLYAVAVAADMRRRGIAAALVKHAVAQLAACGCRKLNLQVRDGNAAAVGLYRALGFAVEDRISMGLRLTVEAQNC